VDKRAAAWLEGKQEPSERDEQLINDSFEMMTECAEKFGEGPVGEGLVGIVEFMTKQMCECNDLACVQEVQKRFVDRIKNEGAPSQDEQKRIRELMQEMVTCIEKIQAKR